LGGWVRASIVQGWTGPPRFPTTLARLTVLAGLAFVSSLMCTQVGPVGFSLL